MRTSEENARYYRLHALLIEAATLQRRALKEARWVTLDDAGAYRINEAAHALRKALLCLQNVSAELLLPDSSNVRRVVSRERESFRVALPVRRLAIETGR